MTRRPSRQRPRGVVFLDVLIASGLIVTVLVTLAMTNRQTGELNSALLASQRCTLAAEAQLDSFSATGEAMDANALARAFPDVSMRTTSRPGQGQWASLRLVEVVASQQVGGKTVRARLSRYLPRRDEP